MAAVSDIWPLTSGLAAMWLLTSYAAYMTGQSLANTWRAEWQVVVYAALLGVGERFLTYALFEGILLSPQGYLVDTVVLSAVSVFAYRFNRAKNMVNQYPWLYERTGLFYWREKSRTK
jgi:branched-chain amino acid transport system ATP-binding protein